jgi:hypothetical protein
MTVPAMITITVRGTPKPGPNASVCPSGVALAGDVARRSAVVGPNVVVAVPGDVCVPVSAPSTDAGEIVVDVGVDEGFGATVGVEDAGVLVDVSVDAGGGVVGVGVAVAVEVAVAVGGGVDVGVLVSVSDWKSAGSTRSPLIETCASPPSSESAVISPEKV